MTTTPDIAIRRCAVRVVRHGGWSWGPQPRHLVDQVLAALPRLIAERLGDLAADGGPDLEITEPVRIVVSLSLADLLAGRFEPLRHVAVAAGPLPAPSPLPEAARLKPAVRPPGTPRPDLTPAIPAGSQFATLAEFLGRLFQRGELIPFLALLPVDTLEAWYQVLTAPPAATAGTPPGASVSAASAPDLALLGGAGQKITGAPAPPPGTATSGETDRTRRLRDTIAAIVASASRQTASWPPRPSDPAAGSAVRPAPPGPVSARPPYLPPEVTPTGTITARAAIAVATGESMIKATAAGTAARTAPSPTAATDADVSSVLPFLLLGPLAQTGYLAALAPALQPVGLQANTAAFATALAYTVLGPLERGWRRQPEDLAAAAAFAGLSASVLGQDLTEFARIGGPALPALDAVVTRALADGHTADEPLVLASAEDQFGGGLLLLDREGLFPVAWTDTTAGLLPAWRMCGSPPLLVSPTALGALRGLAAAGVTFVVAAPPGRGERWRRLSHRLWTNDHENPVLARHASGYRQAVDLAAELIKALAEERAAVPLAAGPALSRSLLLAAGLGLGTLAWTLWREREPTDPLLALERFADLSARVSFEPHRVRVRLPLGPRHSDLSVHGLLADVHGVPWFGGRVVEFSGG
jgi:hypothetical protein